MSLEIRESRLCSLVYYSCSIMLQWLLLPLISANVIEPLRERYPLHSAGNCSVDEFECLLEEGDFCIPFSAVRDCVVDCPNGADEECGQGLILCDAEIKKINSRCGKCVKEDMVERFCVDHKWENLCNEENVEECQSTRNCVHESWIDDGEDDCGDGSDEKCRSDHCRMKVKSSHHEVSSTASNQHHVHRSGNQKYPSDCADMLFKEPSLTGFSLKKAYNWRCENVSECSYNVLCDFTLFGGGWTILFQRRYPPQIQFNRTMNEYKHGFGVIGKDLEFWLGLDKMHGLTCNMNCLNELLIVFRTAKEGKTGMARYDWVTVMAETDQYKLGLGPLISNTPSMETVDGLFFNRDRIFWSYDNRLHYCPENNGGWWELDDKCGKEGATTNFYATKDNRGILWNNQRLIEISFMIRPKGFSPPK